MQVVVLKILSYNLYKMLPRQETEFSNWHSTLIIADLYVVVIWLKLRFSIFFLNLEVLVSMNINWPNWYKKENKGETYLLSNDAIVQIAYCTKREGHEPEINWRGEWNKALNDN